MGKKINLNITKEVILYKYLFLFLKIHRHIYTNMFVFSQMNQTDLANHRHIWTLFLKLTIEQVFLLVYCYALPFCPWLLAHNFIEEPPLDFAEDASTSCKKKNSFCSIAVLFFFFFSLFWGDSKMFKKQKLFGEFLSKSKT